MRQCLPRLRRASLTQPCVRVSRVSRSARALLPLMGALGFAILSAQAWAAPSAQAPAQPPAQTARIAQRAAHTAEAPLVANLVLTSQTTARASAASAAASSVPAMIRQTFGAYSGRALAVARCESGYNPSARNPSSGAMGVFQFLPSTWRGTSYAGYSPYNAWANIQAAHQVFVRDGYSWREWSC